MPHDVDLGRAGRCAHPVDKGGQFGGTLVDGCEAAECADRPRRPRDGAIGQREDAVAVVSQQRRIGTPVGLRTPARTVHENDGPRMLGSRLAIPVVGPGQGAAGPSEFAGDTGEEVVVDGQWILRRHRTGPEHCPQGQHESSDHPGDLRSLHSAPTAHRNWLATLRG